MARNASGERGATWYRLRYSLLSKHSDTKKTMRLNRAAWSVLNLPGRLSWVPMKRRYKR